MKMHLFNRFTKILITLVLSLAATATMAGDDSLTEKINAAAGRAVFVDANTIKEKIHTWGDVKKWFPPRGEDALRMAYPENMKASGISEEIVVYIIITPDGKAINPRIENLKNKELAVPVIMHLAQLQFQRPKLNGKPIYYQQKVKLVCSENPKFGRK